MNLLLLRFNNYYNRKLILEQDYSDYESEWLFNINFNPNDGITTTQIVSGQSLENAYIYDYLVVYKDDEIVSRWFIMNTERTRVGQYNLTLKRDTLADYYDDYKDAPLFVEKATLDNDNPLIFNSEQMTYNQIKTEETLIKDPSDCAWLVGYIDRDQKESIPINISDGTYTSARTVSTDIQNYYTVDNNDKYFIFTGLGYYVKYKPGDTTYFERIYGAASEVVERYLPLKYTPDSVELKSLYDASMGGDYTENTENETFTDYQKLQEKIVNDSSNNFYKFTLILEQDDYTNVFRNGTPINELVKKICGYGPAGSTTLHSPKRYKPVLDRIYDGSLTITLSTDREHLTDAPYDMFCFPLRSSGTSVYKVNEGIVNTHQLSMDIPIRIGQAIAKQAGSNIYDIQILPYCPIVNAKLVGTSGILMVDENADYYTDRRVIKCLNASGQVRYAGFWCDKSTFSNYSPTEVIMTDPSYKVMSETDTYRLVSPNYNGTFEFKACMNKLTTYAKALIDRFKLDCTYKPYQPYIHVAPDWGYLYGADYNDARGLICNGDFSISMMDDKWVNYEIQNKNYQTMFNREVENLNVQQKWQTAEGIVNAVSSPVKGATMGSVIGPWGAIAGAAVGAVEGGLNLAEQLSLQKETLDYKHDVFNAQLGNIKALPSSITKLSSVNNNYKYFPVLEYYTCTDIEKEALRNKIKYDGMTVNAIGTLSSYAKEDTYIKGQLVMDNQITSSYRVLLDIANELNTGVRTYGI